MRLALLLLVAIQGLACADDVLRGLRSISVSVPDAQECAKEYLKSDTIKAKIELRLRQSGLVVDDTDSAILQLTVSAICEENGRITYSIALKLFEAVLLRGAVQAVSTWWEYQFGFSGRTSARDRIEKVALDVLDFFLNDYLKANPRPSLVPSKQP